MSFITRKIFIGTVFTILFIGELSFEVYTNNERTLVTLAKQERAELDSVLIRDDVLYEKKQAEEREKPLKQGNETYTMLNKRAEGKKELFQPYSDKIFAADKQIDKCWEKYWALVEKLQSPIRDEYTDRRKAAKSWLGMLTGIQYGLSASALAVLLAFFSTLTYDAWRWILLALSFVAQFTACTMIYSGAMLKFNDSLQAWSFAIMFFSCAPIAFHWGIIICQNNGSMQTHGVTLTTTTHTTTKSITLWTCDKDGWVKAITSLARERNSGNGSGMLSEIADHFDVNKGVVCRAVKLAMLGKPINVPRKFIPAKHETTD